MKTRLACFLVGWSLLGSRLAAEPLLRPNVLVIVCDDLNTHVSTSGYRHIKTPAFDALALAGMRFGRAYCQYPVCGPSRSSFLSGLYPESTRVLDNKSDIRQRRPGIVRQQPGPPVPIMEVIQQENPHPSIEVMLLVAALGGLVVGAVFVGIRHYRDASAPPTDTEAGHLRI